MMPHAGAMRLHLLLALTRVAVGYPAGDAQQVLSPPSIDSEASSGRKLSGRFLHITDFHPDELYKAHTSIETSCHRGSGPAGVYGAETTDCDSPFSLVNATFDWIADNLKDSVDFVIWTGDSARHDGDEDNPRTPDSVLYTNRMMSDKFVETFSNKNGRLSIPVIPTFGNNDFLPHNIMDPGPNRWLSAYSDVWRRFIPEEQRHSFEFGGWFYVEAIPNKLAVFSLNTMFFFDRNAAVDGCAAPSEPGFKHMEWLRVQLELLRERGIKAIIMGHVPPARTAGKQNWDETCWQRYTLWLQQYRDVVITGLYGHMNIDHFLLGDTREITIDAAEEEDVSGAEVMREAMGGDDDFSVASKSDYLVELRDQWSGLPGTAGRISTLAEDEDEGASEEDEDEAEEYTVAGKKKKGKKGKRKRKGFKKIGGKYAERYQLSFISPSIVPNYLPTLRIFEYNITGLEDAPTWKDGYSGALSNSQQFAENDYETETDRQELKRSVGGGDDDDDDDDDDQVHETGRKKKKGKKGRKGDKKKKKKKHHNDPNLVIPKPPPKHAAPGPAYLPQPLSLVSYTQYLLNLTFINNEGDNDDVPDAAQGGKKKKEKKGKKPPKHKDGKLGIFDFEVEYDTKNDERYKLPDLTVRSMVKLAYRMGKGAAGSAATVSDEVDLNEVEAAGKKKKKGKKKKTTNKTWLAFVRRAFVGTVDDDELEKM